VVLLAGEPGIGKSRLVEALVEATRVDRHIRLRYFCSPYHVNSALQPFIDQLARAAGFEASDSADARLDKLETLLGQAVADPRAAAPFLAALLSIEAGGRYPPTELGPEARKARTLEALADQLAGLAARQPVLVVFEDAHWIDPTSIELLDLVADRLERLPILLVVTFRPEFKPPWTRFAHATSLSLNRLARDNAATIVGRVAAGKPLPAEVMDQILAKTDGVPLFVEELARTVLESGLLADAGDRYALVGALPPLAIPSTLHDSLMARLDRLAPVKEVAQIGACIGREFDHDLLAGVADRPPSELSQALDRLVESELIFRRGAPPAATYTFKHALVRDAAYESLLKSRRQQIHARIAKAIETDFPEVAATRPEILAQHYAAAGLDELAIDYWQKAGEIAMARPAYVEAIAYFMNAIELVRGRGTDHGWLQRELAILAPLGQARIASRGWADPSTLQTFQRARGIAETLDDSPLYFPVLLGNFSGHNVRGELSMAAGIAREMIAVAARRNDEASSMVAHRAYCTVLVEMGEFLAARDNVLRARSLYDPVRDRPLTARHGYEPGIAIRGYLGWTVWCLGYPDQAQSEASQALDLARDMKHVHNHGYTLYLVTLIALLLRDVSKVTELTTETLDIAAKHGLKLWEACAHCKRAWSLAAAGDPAAALASGERGLESLSAIGVGLFLPWFLALQCDALVHMARTSHALEKLREAERLAEATGQRWNLSEIHRARGDLILRCAESDIWEAKACYEQALSIARAQSAKSWELRAATSLARLWAEQGERGKARDLLAPVYGWFTEGFDTADLKEARALLDELG
jgi:predicted ATPase